MESGGTNTPTIRRLTSLPRHQLLPISHGSKFKAVNNRDKNFTPNKIQRRMEIEASIEIMLSLFVA